MPKSVPTYLYRRGNVWWYRQRLPKSCIKNEIRQSLRTSDVCNARLLALVLHQCIARWAQVTPIDPVLPPAGAKGASPSKTTDTPASAFRKQLPGFNQSQQFDFFKFSEVSHMASYAQNSVQDHVRAIINHFYQLEQQQWLGNPRTEAELIHRLNCLRQFQSDTQQAVTLNRFSHAKGLVQEYIDDTQSTMPQDVSEAAVERLVACLLPKMYRKLAEETLTPTGEEMFPKPATPSAPTAPPAMPAPTGPALSEAMSEYLDEKEQKGASTRTINKYQHSLVLALTLFSDVPVHQLNREHGRRLRELVPSLPKGLSIDQMSEQGMAALEPNEGTPTIAPETANNHLKKIREFFRWCCSLGYLGQNPIPDDNIPSPPQSGRDKRQPVNDAEAGVVFQHPIFTEHKGIKTTKIEHLHHYWMPLLVAYTGMRLGEVSQLYSDDVYQVGGIWCIRVEATRDNQRLKTPNAKRLVPVHKELLRLGFIDFVQQRQQATEPCRLFPNIRLINRSYSNKPSEWFCKQLRDKLGLPKHVTPHAFRHSMIEKLIQAGVSDSIRNRLMGHADSVYGASLPDKVEHLKAAIDQISYDDATDHVLGYQADAFHPGAFVEKQTKGARS